MHVIIGCIMELYDPVCFRDLLYLPSLLLDTDLNIYRLTYDWLILEP